MLSRPVKVILISWMCLVSICLNKAEAQIQNTGIYLGVECTYGVRLLRISSDIPEIGQLSVTEESGSLGAVYGNEFIRAKLRMGLSDYAAASYARTVKLFRSEGQVNFYPFQYIRTHQQIIDVYLLGGVSLDVVKFYGHDQHNNTRVNYSNPDEPYLGKVTQYSASLGLGVEYHVPYISNFMHLFTEIKFGYPLLVSFRELSSDTSLGKFSGITIGASFGIHH